MSFPFMEKESLESVSQGKALLTADVIFEGKLIKLENDMAQIQIITPIWNGLKNTAFLKQSEITVPYSYKTHYSLRGMLPELNDKAIFVLKMDTKTKTLKNFYYQWFISRLERGATEYYVYGKYTGTERTNFSSKEIVDGIKTLRKCYKKNSEIYEKAIIKPSLATSEIEKAKETNKAAKVWIEDIEAYNKQITE